MQIKPPLDPIYQKIHYLCYYKKTKPDSLTYQGLPGINTAKIVRFLFINKYADFAQPIPHTKQITRSWAMRTRANIERG